MEFTKILISVLLFLIIVRLLNNRSKQSRIRQLGDLAYIVPSRFPLGLDLAFKASLYMCKHDFVSWTSRLLENNGRTFEMTMLDTRLVFTDHPENIKAIMSTQFAQFGKGENIHKAFENVLGDSIFSTNGKRWLENKNLLRPYLAKLRPTDDSAIEHHVQMLLQHIPTDGRSVQIYDLIERYQLDVFTDIFLGKSANSLNEAHQPFRNSFDRLLRLNSYRLLLGAVGLSVPDRWLAPGSLRQLNAYFDSVISEARTRFCDRTSTRPEQEYTMMDNMVAQGLSNREIKDQLTAVLLAGRGNTAVLLAWCIYELSQNPHVVERLKAEIETILGSSLPTQALLQDMPYLKNTIRETIRLHHPLGINVREANLGTSLPVGGGLNGEQPVGLLAGTTVAYSISSLQRRPDLVGPDHDQFRPERWETWTPDIWHYIPFNHGQRICLGRNFGQFGMGYTLVRLLQQFDKLEDANPKFSKLKIKLEFNTKMASPVFCRFYKKN
ncbi:cytochrome P450 [Nemania abortiva]|nr:cytochrome P450 [Nemania abortiva]